MRPAHAQRPQRCQAATTAWAGACTQHARPYRLTGSVGGGRLWLCDRHASEHRTRGLNLILLEPAIVCDHRMRDGRQCGAPAVDVRVTASHGMTVHSRLCSIHRAEMRSSDASVAELRPA